MDIVKYAQLNGSLDLTLEDQEYIQDLCYKAIDTACLIAIDVTPDHGEPTEYCIRPTADHEDFETWVPHSPMDILALL